MGIPELLTGHEDAAISILSVFLYRLRRDFRGPNGRILSGTIATHLSAVTKVLSNLVAPEELQRMGLQPGSQPPALKEMLAAFRREDPPPNRQWPINATIIKQLVNSKPPENVTPAKWEAVVDMCVLGFFFLLRPGEYAEPGSADSRSKPFCLRDIEFRTTSGRMAPPMFCNDTNYALLQVGILSFVDQKNAKKGDRVSHWQTGQDICPVRALCRRCLHICTHTKEPTTPLYVYYVDGTPCSLQAKDLTDALRVAAGTCFAETGIDPQKISIRSLRAGGATALLCAGIDKETIKLIGRWRSDAMDTYLRTSTFDLTRHYSAQMLAAGGYRFNPKTADDVPDLLPEDLSDELVTACHMVLTNQGDSDPVFTDLDGNPLPSEGASLPPEDEP